MSIVSTSFSATNMVWVAIKQLAGQMTDESGFHSRQGKAYFSSPKHTDFAAFPAPLFNVYRDLFPRSQSGRDLNLTSHLHLLLRLRMCTCTLPYTLTRTYLFKHRNKPPLTFIFLRISVTLTGTRYFSQDLYL